MIKNKEQWITVGQYAEKYNLTRGKIYMDFYFGRLKNKAKKVEMKKDILMILDLPPGEQKS